MCRDEPLLKSKRSHCVSCGKELEVKELFPVFSYLWLKGRCSACKKLIPPVCFLSEVSLGLVFAVAWYFSGLSLGNFNPADVKSNAVLFVIFSCFVLFAAVTDYIEQSVFVYPAFLGMAVCWGFNVWFNGFENGLKCLLFGGVGYVSVYVINLFSGLFLHKDGLGEGDGLLFAMSGLALGGKYMYYFVTAGFILAAIFSIREMKRMKEQGITDKKFPLVPFLYAGLIPSYVVFAVLG